MQLADGGKNVALFGWFGRKKKEEAAAPAVQDGPVRVSCPKCKGLVLRDEAVRKKYICPRCGGYFRVSTANRLRMVADPRSFTPWFEQIPESNPLDDSSYQEKLEAAREKTGLSEAFTIGEARIFGERAVIGICDSRFLMGSMGYAVGERIARGFERAERERLPVFLFCCSGGARMQEGIISLMQMEKTAAAVRRFQEAGLFYCSILTDPTMGGVTASFAMLGDVIMAEPGALIGFAGPRVIQQTIGQTLPDGFQTAEFLQQHGMIDGIVQRKNLKKTMYFLLKANRKPQSPEEFQIAEGFLSGQGWKAAEMWKEAETEGMKSATDESADAKPTAEEPAGVEWKKRAQKTPWEKVTACRNANRPSAMDYVSRIFSDFIEAHGDRLGGDDRALIGGLAFLENQPVTVLLEEKGRDMQGRMAHNFGMPKPEGYRKAVRLMKQAEKFGRPVISFVNTPGAFCGIDAEERGQGEAIARCLYEMSGLKVPVLCILIGEGGSGGALATASGNRVWMLENATYAILSPEGYSSILWKTSEKAADAAAAMKLTAQDLERLRVIDRIIPEFGGAGENTVDAISDCLKVGICEFLRAYDGRDGREIEQERYWRFRNF